MISRTDPNTVCALGSLAPDGIGTSGVKLAVPVSRAATIGRPVSAVTAQTGQIELFHRRIWDEGWNAPGVPIRQMHTRKIAIRTASRTNTMITVPLDVSHRSIKAKVQRAIAHTSWTKPTD
jgi:hypothetical protein